MQGEKINVGKKRIYWAELLLSITATGSSGEAFLCTRHCPETSRTSCLEHRRAKTLTDGATGVS